MFKIVIFAQTIETFLDRKLALEQLTLGSVSVIWCDSSRECRGALIGKYEREWLLFLDHDCNIDQGIVDSIKKIISKVGSVENRIYTGIYLNPEPCSYFQRGHNFIANTWLSQSYEDAECNKLLLGGAFLIYSKERLRYSHQFIFWGVEDKVLSYELNDRGFVFDRLPELRVLHNTNDSIWHFVRRAFLHGRNEVKYLNINKNKINYQFWIRRIDSEGSNLWPLILLHFCIQRAGVSIQRVLQLNKLLESDKNRENPNQKKM